MGFETTRDPARPGAISRGGRRYPSSGPDPRADPSPSRLVGRCRHGSGVTTPTWTENVRDPSQSCFGCNVFHSAFAAAMGCLHDHRNLTVRHQGVRHEGGRSTNTVQGEIFNFLLFGYGFISNANFFVFRNKPALSIGYIMSGRSGDFWCFMLSFLVRLWFFCVCVFFIVLFRILIVCVSFFYRIHKKLIVFRF